MLLGVQRLVDNPVVAGKLTNPDEGFDILAARERLVAERMVGGSVASGSHAPSQCPTPSASVPLEPWEVADSTLVARAGCEEEYRTRSDRRAIGSAA